MVVAEDRTTAEGLQRRMQQDYGLLGASLLEGFSLWQP